MVLRPLLVLIVFFLLPAARSFAQTFEGRTVRGIRIQNVEPDDEQRLRDLLPAKINEPYSALKIRESVERLYATGRFSDIQVDAQPADDGVALNFLTSENYFIGGVFVEEVPAPPTESQQAAATRLELGTLWTEERQNAAIDGLKRVLQDNGLYQAQIQTRLDKNQETQQVNVHFIVTPGERASIAEVRVTGSPGFPPERIVKESKLKPGQKVTARRLQNALNRLRGFYQKHHYLEATIGVADRQYLAAGNKVVVVLEAKAGPKVDVNIAGAKLSAGRRRQLIPIYQEGSVDADLVREGESNIRDYFQRRGRFEAEVTAHVHEEPAENKVTVEYHVEAGPGHQVTLVELTGNRYFSGAVLRERMFIAEKGLIGNGRFSRALLNRDVETIRNLYIANGFQHVNVTSEVEDDYQGKKGNIAVHIRVEEGPQTLVRVLRIEGNQAISADELRGQIASLDGQPFSEFNIGLDRDTLLTYYFNRGFREADFAGETHPVPGRPDRMDVVYKITEGPRRYVDRVLVSGLENTRRHIIDQQVLIEEGKPLSQLDMLETQRQQYDLGIFQSVDMAVQNPEGQESYKNVLIQVTEARRWTLAVGGGADVARFGGDTQSLANTQGRTGFSPRVSFDVTRLNFRGLDHTVALKTAFSTLQKRVLFSYQAPRVWNVPNLTLLFNGYLDRRFDVLTFASRRLEGSVALQQKRGRTDTILYRYSYRRVTAERDTLKVSVQLIPLFARPVRVGMLGASFVRDRRDDPTDSRRGMYLTVDTGIAAHQVGSEASFSRAVAQYASYHRLTPRLVLARNTQFGLAEPFGRLRQVRVLNEAGQPEFQFTRDVPLPERLFSGGGNAHRGFGVNQAGPRDPVTGFPVGGNAMLINSLELRFPVLGPNIGGALFHDMGNVFSDLREMSFRVHQRDHGDFNYMVHALGVGLRYKTPIGPLRLDLAYSINPPTFFGLTGTRQELLAGGGHRELRSLSHIQFFFSIGQTF